MSRNRLYFKLVMCIKHVITGYLKKHTLVYTHSLRLHQTFKNINQMVNLNLSKASGGSLSMHFNKYFPQLSVCLERNVAWLEHYHLIKQEINAFYIRRKHFFPKTKSRLWKIKYQTLEELTILNDDWIVDIYRIT